MCFIYTEAGQRKRVEIDVLRSCMVHQDLGKGFLISFENQFRDKDGVSWQILYEKSCLPIALRKELNLGDLTKLIGQIFRDYREEAERQQFSNVMKSKMLDKLLWLVAMPCSVALIWGAMTILKRQL